MAIMFLSRRQRSREEGNGIVKADFVKEVFVYMHLRDFCCPLTLSDYSRSAFYPSLPFTFSLQSAHFTQSAFYPRSAVRSLRFELTDLRSNLIFHYKQTFL